MSSKKKIRYALWLKRQAKREQLKAAEENLLANSGVFSQLFKTLEQTAPENCIEKR